MQMVSEVMTRNVQSISPHESVRRAAQMMDDLNVGALPVCDGERLVGIVTDRDIVVRSTSVGLSADDAAVDDVMSTDVRWCFEDQPIDDVMRQMADSQIRRVPVVSHDAAHRLLGIVSLGDLATAASDDADAPKQKIAEVVGKVSFPSEPDLSARGSSATSSANATGTSSGSHPGAALGLAGADVEAEIMNPNVEVSSTADPSEVVEVTPADLVNRNAPGAMMLDPAGTGAGLQAVPEGEVVVRHTIHRDDDSSSGETGAPAGIDTGGAGASGGTAGVAGSAGSDAGAKA